MAVIFNGTAVLGQRGVEVMDIVNLAAISVVDALERESAGTS